MQDAPCPLRDPPTRLAGHQLAQREPRPVPEKWHSVSQLPVVGGDEIYAGFTGPGVTRLITRNPANSVNVARQMRAAAAAHPAGDKARVVVIAVAAPVAGVIDRIALLKRSAGRRGRTRLQLGQSSSPAPDKKVSPMPRMNRQSTWKR